MKTKITKEVDDIACDLCGKPAVGKCAGCGKDLCYECHGEGHQVHAYTLSDFSLERTSLNFCAPCVEQKNRHFEAARRIRAAADRAAARLKDLNFRIGRLQAARSLDGMGKEWMRLSVRNSPDGAASDMMAAPPPERGPCGLVFYGRNCRDHIRPECGSCASLAAAKKREQEERARDE